MTRPVTIHDEDLLRAARETFLERGIQATTAEVAARAGVSEGILFHRFGSKAGLFLAAMTPPDGAAFFKELDLESRVGKGELFDQMCEIADRLVDFIRKIMPVTMMSWSNPADGGVPKALRGPNPVALRMVRGLACYFEAEMRVGRLRAVDPETLARAFEGGVHQYVFGEVVGRGERLPMPQKMYVRGLVDVLLRGAAPQPDDPLAISRRSMASAIAPNTLSSPQTSHPHAHGRKRVHPR